MATVPNLVRRRFLRQLAGGCVISWSCFAKPYVGEAAAARPLILLDPGHGGRDLGATGVAGTLEKHVTLGSVQALKAALEASGRYRVALTRAKDQYLALDDRVDIAEDMKPALFISLHADKAADNAVRGAAVYTLAHQASDPAAAVLAERENVGGGSRPGSPGAVSPEVAQILMRLAGQEVRAASFRIAHQLVRNMTPDIPALPAPERRAKFAVLQAAGIPSVLIEMGFLSNTADEAALNDPAHREAIARWMTRAVDAWFANARGQEPSQGPSGQPSGRT